MEILGNLALGFSVSLQPANLAYCFIGVLLGTLACALASAPPRRLRCCYPLPTVCQRLPP